MFERLRSALRTTYNAHRGAILAAISTMVWAACVGGLNLETGFGLVADLLFAFSVALIGVPNVLNGTAILSPPDARAPFAIDIADPCSGIRSLFALVMMAALAAFILYRHTWQKLVIIVLSVPLVILGNLVRILLLTLATIHFGEAFALGVNDHPSWFHEGAGYAVYLINFGSLLGVGWLLTKLSPDRPATKDRA